MPPHESPALSGDEMQCVHCGKSCSGQVVSHQSYMNTPTSATPARLGHLCSQCGAVSCEACKKKGIGWSTWSGYEKAACQSCSAGVDALRVIVAGSGNLCRAYGGETRPRLASDPPRGSFSVAGGWENFSNILWGLVALGGVAAMYFLVILPSQGTTVEFDFKYPGLALGLVAFAGWEIVRGGMKLNKAWHRSVTLDADRIAQNDVTIAWSDIRSLKLFRKGDKLKPIAVLTGPQDQTIEVVWMTRNLDYVLNAVASHLPPDCRVEVV
jgi:hypothetical protein